MIPNRGGNNKNGMSCRVNSPTEVNIITVEDPVEYRLPGINQVQTNPKAGLTFAAALRSILRSDPDIVLIGEIRDGETSQIAVEAALTGHLVLSTLHTNDAPSTVARIGEMGVEPFNISASLICVCAQRLLRRVCKGCKVAYEPQGREKALLEKAIGGKASMLQDVEAGRRTEIDVINGAIVAAGKRHGVPTPHNDAGRNYHPICHRGRHVPTLGIDRRILW